MTLDIETNRTDKKRISVLSENGQFVVIEENLDKKPDQKGPVDKFFFFRITCLFLGLCSTTPMTFILTENQYWMYKFRNVSSTNVSSDGSDRTFLQANFSSTCSLVTSVASVIFMFLTTFAGHKFKTKTRVYGFFISLIVIFSIHTGFVGLDTDTWQYGFFILVMVTLAVKTSVGSICGVALISMVSKFPSYCLHYFLLGQGVGDIFSPTLSLVTLAIIPSFTDAALMYFIVGTLILALSMIQFYFASRTEYFKYYHKFSDEETKKAIHKPSKILSVFKQVWVLTLLAIIMMILPVHTAITSLVVSEYKGTGDLWGETYFVPVVTYFLGSVASTLGRVVSTKSKLRNVIPFIFTLTVLNSAIFPPIIYFCNAQPRHHLPVVFKKDWEYTIFLLTYRFLCGYLMNSNMLLTVKLVKSKEDFEVAFAMNGLLFSILGTFTSFIGVALVNLL